MFAVGLRSRSMIVKRGYGSDTTVLQLLRKRVEQGPLRHDPGQEEVAEILNSLAIQLKGYKPEPYVPIPQTGGGFFSSLMKGSLSTPKQSTTTTSSFSLQDFPRNKPQGVYLYGGVGTGKTMLMDLFLEVAAEEKQRNRVHFNSFMLDVHHKIHLWRTHPTKRTNTRDNAIDSIVEDIVNRSLLLCFDEFQVTNIADAMLLGRLFTSLWKSGAVVVCTSNRHPDQLYKSGLQRDLFLPFIDTLKLHCHVHCLDSDRDYRLVGDKHIQVFQLATTADARKAALDDIWNTLTENRHGEPKKLDINGRTLVVQRVVKGIARFSFNDLCCQPLGSADFGKIAASFHTVLIDDIPKLTLSNLNEARRFITLIDELYQHGVKLICSSEVEPNGIFPKERVREGSAAEEEVFAFDRVVSRLTEMQTRQYLERKGHINNVL